MLARILLSLLVLFGSIIITSYGSYVNLELLKAVSNNRTPATELWFAWIVTRMISVYSYVPILINILTSSVVTKIAINRFMTDVSKCSYTKISTDVSKLTDLYGKIQSIRYIPMKIGWCLSLIHI